MAVLPVAGTGEWLYEEVSEQIEYSGAITLVDGTPDSITGVVGEINVHGTIVRSRELCDVTSFDMVVTNFVVAVANFGTEFADLPFLAFNPLITALVLNDNRVEQSERGVWRHIQVWDAVSVLA